jgi:hypothetical protein
MEEKFIFGFSAYKTLKTSKTGQKGFDGSQNADLIS